MSVKRWPMRSLALPIAFPLALAWLYACQPAADAGLQGLALTEDSAGITLTDRSPKGGPEGDGAGPPFRLHCDHGNRQIVASAAASQLGPYAKAGTGELVVSGASFPGQITLAPDSPERVEFRAALTSELLAAIAGTRDARIVIGDGFAQSNLDDSQAFLEFAQACATKSAIAFTLPA